MGQGMGNKKSSKRDQPKRKRYNAERRYEKNQVRNLRKHLKHYPNDKAAQEYLDKMKTI